MSSKDKKIQKDGLTNQEYSFKHAIPIETVLSNNSSEDKKTSLGQSAKYHIEKYFNSIGDDLPSSGLFDKILREVEKPLIYATMRRTSGNQIKASEILGINRNTLRKKIKSIFCFD